MAPPGFFVFLFSAQSLLRNFTEAPTGCMISLSYSEVSPAGIRLPISLTSRQARKFHKQTHNYHVYSAGRRWKKLRAAGAVSRYAQ